MPDVLASPHAVEFRGIIAAFARRFPAVARSGLLSQPGVGVEIAHVSHFLEGFRDSVQTFKSYRKEVDRVVLWSLFQCRKPLSQLTRDDAEAYAEFLHHPAPKALWVQDKGTRLHRLDPEWKPFFPETLCEKSRRHALAVVRQLLSWLVRHAGFHDNPFLAARKRPASAYLNYPLRHVASDVERGPANLPMARPVQGDVPDHETWRLVKDGIAAMSAVSPRARARRARLRWLFFLLHSVRLTLAEICRARMDDIDVPFHPENPHDGVLRVKGMRAGDREIPLTARFFEELMLYRTDRGLFPLPIAGEDVPLILPISDVIRYCDPATLYQALRMAMTGIAHDLYQRGKPFYPQADVLLNASLRWL
jgi:integrase